MCVSIPKPVNVIEYICYTGISADTLIGKDAIRAIVLFRNSSRN